MSPDLSWTVPNDPYFRPWPQDPCQWNLFLLDVPAAWEIEKGRPDIVVAVADDGVQIDHPDIANQIWINPTPGKAGYPDDIHGWDFRDNDNTVDDHGVTQTRPLLGPHGHGTHVAGIIAAEANNGIGIAGIAPGCKIMPIRLNAYDDHQTALAIRYALAYGVRIFSCNGAYYPPLKVNPDQGFAEFYIPPTRELAEACAEAYERGMLLVFAGGGNRGPRNYTTYPACYEEVIQVGPCNMHGDPSNFMPVNPTIEVLAPGGNRPAAAANSLHGREGVLSLFDKGGYDTMSGGCMSTPHVSGVLALILSKNPEWTTEEARMILRNTASGIGWSETRGHGVINARRALEVSRVDVALDIVHVMGWRAGLTQAVRQDVPRLPIDTTAEMDGVPVTLQAVVRNTGVRDLARGMVFFYAGDPAQGGQMVAVREFSVNGLESVIFNVSTVVAESCPDIYVLVDPFGAQTFDGLPYTIAKGPIVT